MQVLFLFLLLCRISIATEPTLLDKQYDNLDAASLGEILNKYSLRFPTTPSESTEYITALFFSAERAYFDGAPHLADELLLKALIQCDLLQLKEGSQKSQGACLLVYSGLYAKAPAFEKLGFFKKAQVLFEKTRTSDLTQAEKFYLEGRFYQAFADAINPKLAKSLLAFQMLKRLRPDLTQTSFWLTYLYLQGGNLKAYEENLSIALKERNIRSVKFFGEGKGKIRTYVEGVSFGNRFGLFANPVDGLGAGYVVWDDRIFDKDRGARLFASASTEKNFAVAARYREALLFTPFSLDVENQWNLKKAEYYGQGLESRFSDKSLYRRQVWYGKIQASRPLVSDLNFAVGWEFYQRHAIEDLEGPFSFSRLNGENIFYSGGYFQADWDTREAEDYARGGGRLFLKGYFPTRGLGSSWTFQKWIFLAEKDFAFFDILNRLTAGSILTEGDAPIDALAFSSQDGAITGLREGRLRELHLSHVSLETKRKVWGPFVAGAFVTGLFPKLHLEELKLAKGALFEIYLSQERRRQLRLDAGFFKDEFVFNVNLGLSL